MSEARILTDEELRQIGALQVTPGSWWPSQRNGPNDVDRGKIWGFRAGPPPAQMVAVAEVNRFIGTAEDQQLIAAAPDLRRTALHLLQQRDKAPAHLRVALANAARAFQRGDLAALATVNEALQPLVDAAVSQIIGARSEVDRLRIRVAELEAPGECQSLHKLRAEVERLKARLL